MQPAARFQRPEGLAEYLALVGREIDDAVGQDHVGGGLGHRQVLDLAEAELHLRVAALICIAARLGDHLRRHVDADDVAVRSDGLGRQEAIQAAAGAQIQHRFADFQAGHGGRVAAADAEVGLFRHRRQIVGAIAEFFRRDRIDGIAAAPAAGGDVGIGGADAVADPVRIGRSFGHGGAPNFRGLIL